jgi:hypothetical protein
MFNLVVFEDLVDDLHMGDKHSPAAVSIQAQVVEHGFRAFTCGYAPDKGLPLVADDLSAGEASYRYYRIYLSPSYLGCYFKIHWT